jgi:hypothetical protein
MRLPIASPGGLLSLGLACGVTRAFLLPPVPRGGASYAPPPPRVDVRLRPLQPRPWRAPATLQMPPTETVVSPGSAHTQGCTGQA